MEKCAASGECLRPACYLLEDDAHHMRKHLCYFHAACLPQTHNNNNQDKLALLQVSIAKQQAKPFKNLAAEVWDSLSIEFKDAEAKQRSIKPPPPPRLAHTPPPPLPPQPPEPPAATSNKRARESFFDLVQQQTDDNNTPLLLVTPCPDETCPQCSTKGMISYQCISSAISASKSDTWGNSSRPDRVLKYTCANCSYAWLVEEG